ncbi:hypothetical protein EX30DRAFT_101258 [Ascodesmis nigricans]|uniref:TPR-like protein n=1 Tax=Ascodesmis nigricans TaxID=341454 RepID=A0A4S2N4L8_9PEZI|nr:hypothetical protein EX30DRAFT_101258 [Ascodesmis nigricans]
MWTEKAFAHYALAAYRCWMEGHAAPPLALQAGNGTPTPDQNGLDSSAGENGGDVGVAIGNTIVDEQTVASAFRIYHKFVDAAPSDIPRPSSAHKRLVQEVETERRELYRRYFKFLSLVLLPPQHPRRPQNPAPAAQTLGPADNTITPVASRQSTKLGTREQLQEELRQIQVIYEKYLMRTVGFPKADECHEIIGEWVDQVMENWEVSGGSGDDAAPVVEILYRAARRTFHSPRVLRQLVITLTATGNFSDALSALGTYMDLVEKAKERIAKGHHEKDMDSDLSIFETVTEGIRIMSKFLSDGARARDVAVRMEKWVKEWHVRDKAVLAVAHRGIGMAYALWSRVAPDGDQRPSSQTRALEAFKKALHYDFGDIQGWYGLSLIQAEMGQTDDAVENARRGLGILKATYLDNEEVSSEVAARDYKKWAVYLLHLYALLMTAKDDFLQATRICENAFEIIGQGREAVSELGVYDKIAVFELEMTQLAITETTDDAEAAIASIDRILTAYGTLFDGTHLVQREEHNNADERPFTSAASSRPATMTSRRSRLFGGKSHKKQFSASATSLTRSNDNEMTSPPGTAARERQRPSSGHARSNTGQMNAPTIQVTEANPDASPTPDRSSRRTPSTRTNSVSGGTARRMRSLGSLRIKGGEHQKPDESPTPPLPSSTEASSLNFSGAGTGRDPHLFHMLKTKLHRHQLQQGFDSGAASSTTSVNLEPLSQQPDGAENAAPKEETTKVDALPINHPRKQMPFPINAIGRALPEDADKGKTRSIRRPMQLPEPKLAVEEERRRVLAALRKAWLCVAGMYRRAGYVEDAAMAVGEAEALITNEGDGEADVLAEKGYLAIAQSKPTIAIDFFEAALTVEPYHPPATIGLSRLLLSQSDHHPHEPPSPTAPSSDWPPPLPTSPVTSRPDSTDSASYTSSTSQDDMDPELEDAVLDRLAARDRALGLLEKLVGSVKGWNCKDAWWLLATILEKTGEVERAKTALWKVVELEDTVGVRMWEVLGLGAV